MGKNLIKKVLRRIFLIYLVYIKKSKFHVAHRKWVKDNGDKTLRYKYNLNGNSIVFDLGGYKGDFAAKIYEKYHSTVYVFEPIEEYYDHITKRFSANENIKVYNFGLSCINKKTKILLNDDGSSVHGVGSSSDYEVIDLKNITDFIKENNIDIIDLMKINIEGGEFEVLPELIKTNDIVKVDNIQVQFHEFADQAKYKRGEIQKNLRKTHKLTYEYYFVWEGWEKK